MSTTVRQLSVFVGRVAAGAAIIACLLPTSAFAKDYTRLNIFGDSLVDTGNLFNLSGFPPSPPYAQKFSNDTVWVEPFADELGLSPILSTELPLGLSPDEGINFALAGSLTSDQNVTPQLPGLQTQIETFRQLSPTLSESPESLFVLLAGGNDYNAALASAATDASVLSAIPGLPDQVTSNLTSATASLIEAGAKNILVANLPNLGRQPLVAQLDRFIPQASTLLSALTAQHNQLLSEKLTALSATTDAEIVQLDVAELFESISTTPADFGFTNTTESCLTNFQSGFIFDGICANPDEFVFWDNIHPSAAAHDAIARSAINLLNAQDDPIAPSNPRSVPEPANAAAFLLFGTGTLMLTRQAKKATKKCPAKS